MSRQTERRLLIITFIAPALLLYAIFALYPTFMAFRISLYRWDGMSPQLGPFVGIGNFVRVASDKSAQKAIVNNLFFLAVPAPIILILALFFAEVLNRGIKGAGFFQVVFFFPGMLSMVVVAVIWIFIYAPTFGLVNGVLRTIGLDQLARPWLGMSGLVAAFISVAWVWMRTGYNIVLLLAAMKNIPRELYEVAELEGANAWQRFREVTLPLISDTVRVTVTLLFLGAIQQFALVWVMTEGGPAGASEVMGTLMYKNAFSWSNIGYGSALAVVMFILVFGLSIGVFQVTRTESVEL